MRTIWIIVTLASPVWGQVPPLPGTPQAQQQYQNRLQEIERFNQEVYRQRQWQEDQRHYQDTDRHQDWRSWRHGDGE